MRAHLGAAFMAGAVILSGFAAPSVSQTAAEPAGLAPLTATQTPLPNLAGIVRDVEAARRLGKALFWDVNVGSDGMACASCHFAGGADTRIQNQLSPGLTDLRWSGGDKAFGGLVAGASGMTPTAVEAMRRWAQDFSPAGTAGKLAGGRTAAPGVTLEGADFPLHRLSNPDDRNSAIVYTTNDAVSSQGVRPATFVGLTDQFGELCEPEYDSPFLVRREDGQLLLRAVEPRNAQSTINAGFHKRNFWDGRANNRFNGFDPFGARSPSAMLLEWNRRNNSVSARRLNLSDAALASQAVGPPLSQLEMSCAGKTFPMLGRKMLGLSALQGQAIHPSDSLLGSLAASRPSYRALIQQAFDERWWAAPANAKYRRSKGQIVADSQGFSQAELNFSMFWGISIMLYESTLVSERTPFDRSFGGSGPRELTKDERAGLAVFTGKAKCINCHAGPIFSKGTVAQVEHMPMADARPAFYDGSFYNIGVNYTVTDIGLGGIDPWGNPLSFTRQLLGGRVFDSFGANLCTTESIPFPFTGTCDPARQRSQAQADAANQRVAIDGAFQTPTLRNIGLTPPYFHNGSAATLAQLVEFYDRGGNRRGELSNDTTGTGPLGRPLGKQDPVAAYRTGSNLDPDIERLNLTGDERKQLVAFLLSLTDNRVSCDQAPFDHPELPIPAADGTRAQFVLPAVGAGGLPAAGRSCRPNSGKLLDEYKHLSQFKY